MLVWSSFGAFWAYLRQQQQTLLPSAPNRSQSSTSTDLLNKQEENIDTNDTINPESHNYYQNKANHWLSSTSSATAKIFGNVASEEDGHLVNKIFNSLSHSFSINKSDTSHMASDTAATRVSPNNNSNHESNGINVSSQISQTSQTPSDSLSKCSDLSLSNNSSMLSGRGGRGHIPYHAIDIAAGHHHHCCHQYHPYTDPSLTEPSCPLLIFRESPSSATTVSSSIVTHPSPYQSTPELDLTSECVSECGMETMTGVRLMSNLYLATSRRSKLINSESGTLCTIERCRTSTNKASSCASTPSMNHCSVSTRSHASSSYYYTHRHSSSAVMSHSNSSMLGTQISSSLATIHSRRHRSSYPSTGIRHSISGTLRIGPRLYQGRSSQRCAYDRLLLFLKFLFSSFHSIFI